MKQLDEVNIQTLSQYQLLARWYMQISFLHSAMDSLDRAEDKESREKAQKRIEEKKQQIQILVNELERRKQQVQVINLWQPDLPVESLN